jgi:hypothetical protein
MVDGVGAVITVSIDICHPLILHNIYSFRLMPIILRRFWEPWETSDESRLQ